MRWPSEATPELAQVVVGQLGQDLGVDLVVAERLLVLLQAPARAAKPRRPLLSPDQGVLAPTVAVYPKPRWC